MDRIRSACSRVPPLGATFHLSSAPAQRASTSRLTSLGDSALVFLDDEGEVLVVETGAVGGAYRVQLSTKLEHVDAIVGSPGQKLLAVWGPSRLYVVEVDLARVRASRPQRVLAVAESLFQVRPGVSLADVQWHPGSDGHLAFLSSDATLWMFDVAKSVAVEEQQLSVRAVAGGRPTSFAFGASAGACPGWEAFSVYVLSEDGGLYVVCPFVPYGMPLQASLAKSLLARAEEILAQSSRHGPPGTDQLPPADDLDDTMGADSSFFSEPSLGTRARRRLDFPPSSSDATAAAVASAPHPAAASGGDRGREGRLSSATQESEPWIVQQARRQRQWLHDCVFLRADSSLAVILKPTASTLHLVPLVQGPMFVPDDDDDGGAGTPAEPPPPPSHRRRRCHGLWILDRNPPVLIQAREGNRLDLSLRLEEVEARWCLGDGGQEQEEDRRAGEDSAPGLLQFERVELPDDAAPKRRREPSSSSPLSLSEVPSVFVTRGGSVEEVLFVRGAGGLFCLRMPWLSAMADGNPAALADAPISLLTALIATERGSPPLGGTALFSVPDGTVAMALTASGRLLAASTARSIREWGIASVPEPLTRNLEPSSASPSAKRTAAGGAKGAYAASVGGEYERNLSAVVRSLVAPPTRLAPEVVSGVKTPQEAFGVLQERVSDLQERYLRSFGEVHALITAQAEHCRDSSREQLGWLEELQSSLAEVGASTGVLEAKLERSLDFQNNLTARIAAVMQVVNDGSKKLSRAERRLLTDYKSRHRELQARQERVAELSIAAARLRDDASLRRQQLLEEQARSSSSPLPSSTAPSSTSSTTTHTTASSLATKSTSASPAAARTKSGTTLRTADQNRIHEAVLEHSKALSRANEENAELWRRLRQSLPVTGARWHRGESTWIKKKRERGLF